MREIKFRAWEEQEERMWYDDDFKASIAYKTVISSKNLMQYTGLKDKNGVEIYEGDILKETEGDNDSRSGIRTSYWPVKWGTEYAGYNLGVAPKWSILNPHDLKRMEVVGNIYETPELLNGPNE